MPLFGRLVRHVNVIRVGGVLDRLVRRGIAWLPKHHTTPCTAVEPPGGELGRPLKGTEHIRARICSKANVSEQVVTDKEFETLLQTDDFKKFVKEL